MASEARHRGLGKRLPVSLRHLLGEWRAQLLLTLGGVREISQITGPVHPADDMFQPEHPEHYQAVGREALELLQQAWGEAGKSGPSPRRILDFGCGYGRVLRHLGGFPEASLTAADRKRSGVEFCRQQFQAEGQWMRPGTPLKGGPFDLIWVGSVFSHLAPVTFVDLLQELLDNCASGGLVMLTTHGSSCLDHPEIYPVSLPPREQAESILNSEGFLHLDYPWEPGYGLTLVEPTWVIRAASPQGMLVWHRERAWAAHQDVYCFGV